MFRLSGLAKEDGGRVGWARWWMCLLCLDWLGEMVDVLTLPRLAGLDGGCVDSA